LDEIAQKYQSKIDSIIEFNRITEPANLRSGDRIIIPGGRKLDAAAAISFSFDDQGKSVLPEGEAVVETATKPTARVPQRAEPEPIVVKTVTYVVKPGDTLISIALRFGISTESIIWANDLFDDLLQIDQNLTVPPVSGVIHKVVEGDTARSLAKRYNASTSDIVEANGLFPPYLLQIGQTLIVPGGKPPPPPPPPGPRIIHLVREGESVAAIAEKYSVGVLTIIRGNGLLPPYTILPAQRLVVPGGLVPASASTRPVQQSAVAAAQRAEVAIATARPGPGPEIVGMASKYLGFPYVWGGSSPNVGFDCSGFTWWIFRELGRPIPRDLWGQLQAGRRVDYASLQPGDMIFFVNTYQPGLSHNGIYIGGGRFIHAASENTGVIITENTGVIITSLSKRYWSSRYYAAARHW